MMAGARSSNMNREQAPPLFSAVIVANPTREDELFETLTCLAAQTCTAYEVVVIYERQSGNPRLLIDQVGTLFPSMPFLQISPVADLAAGLAQAIFDARGLYASIINPGDLVTDNWMDSFLAAAASSPGKVISCRAARQLWKRDAAPIIDEMSLFSVGALEEAHASHRGDAPMASWAFPLFAVQDMGILPNSTTLQDNGAFFREELEKVCGICEIQQATVIQRLWTSGHIVSTGDLPHEERAIAHAIPPEIKAPLRFLLSRLRWKRFTSTDAG